MAIVPVGETLISLAESSALFSQLQGKGRPNVAAIYRWAFRGVRSSNGTKALLEFVKIEGVLFTSREAVQRFIEQLGICNRPELLLSSQGPLKGYRVAKRA